MNWNDIRETLIPKAKAIGSTYVDRMMFELSEIEKQGTEAYWLRVAESDQKGLKNPNRLLIAYLLGVSDDDPFYERTTPMLNSIAASSVMSYKNKYGHYPEDITKDTDMPDIDIDCIPESRDPLKEYAIQRYGSHVDDVYGSVCSVGTWQTYKLRSAILDVSSALGVMTRYEAERFTTVMPDEVDDLREGGFSVCKSRIIIEGAEQDCGKVHDAKICPSCNQTDTEAPTIGKLLAEVKELAELYRIHPNVVDYAKQLVGRIRNQGMHAGALIITDRPLFGNVPLAKSGKKGFWVSMWTEGRTTQLSKFGYVKWDLLGLKTVKYLFEACKFIEENRGISFGDNLEGMDYNDPEQRVIGYYFDQSGEKHFMSMDDPAALKLANDKKTDGIFQFDTDNAKGILEHGVKSFEDLMLLNAMGHPGPMQSIPEAMANRDDSLMKWKEKLHPDFLAVLESTYGVIVYQEQLQALWQRLADFTSPESQDARKAVAKKWTHKLKPIKNKWLEGAGKSIGEEAAAYWWEKMETFGRYAFNKSHSVSYCLLTMRCLWLKAHFAPEFWAAIMSDCHAKKLPRYMGMARSEEWKPSEITYSGKYKPETPAEGVHFGTIDINNLQRGFKVSGDSINQGMIGIKGIGDSAALVFAGKGDYKSLDDFVGGEDSGRRSKPVLERFIKLNAFQKLPGHGNSRALWIYYQYFYCSVNKDIREMKAQLHKDIMALEGWDEKTIAKERERQEQEYRRAYPKRNKIPTAITKWMPKIDITLENINKVILDDFTLEERLAFQQDYIGYYLDSPLGSYKIIGDGTIAASKDRAFRDEGNNFLHLVTSKFTRDMTKTGKPYGKIYGTDGLTECMVFVWEKELMMQDEACFEPGIGIHIPVDFDARGMFCVSRRQKISKLKRKYDANTRPNRNHM